MDIRTGRTYDTRDAALADGVPESDVAEITVTRDGAYWPRFERSKYKTPHQGSREITRRKRQTA